MNTIANTNITAPQPFHQRWPQTLRYPLQLGALSTIVAILAATPAKSAAGVPAP